MRKRIALAIVTMLCTCCLGLVACGGSSASSSASASAASGSSAAASSASSAAASSSASSAAASSTSSAEASNLQAVWNSLDEQNAGVHMAYTESNESMGSNAVVDAQGKGPSYYSKKTLKVKDVEDTTITVMLDGVAINLNEDDKTGKVATSTTSSVFKDAMMMDDVYLAISTCAKQKPSTTEQGEMDGKTFTVETYTQSTGFDDKFYFNKKGKLAYYVKGAMKAGKTEIGETVYKIESLDDKVDESMFDVSDYAIEGR